VHVFRWDLDRTYLDTDIHSVQGLVRTALERPEDKRNIPGSAVLMRALQKQDPGARVHLISGSPRQMRQVIEAKLELDGVVVDELTLKDNLGNLKRGRFRAVRGQVGYKLPELLRHRCGLGPTVSETLFGDDNEQDALVYGLYNAVLTRQIGSDDLTRVLEASGVYQDAIHSAMQSLRKLPQSPPIEDAFILLDRRSPPSAFLGLGDSVRPVHSWAQAALVLHARGRLDGEGWVRVAQSCCQGDATLEQALPGWTQDAVRRNLLDRSQALSALEDADLANPIARRVESVLARLGPTPNARPPSKFEPLAWLRRQR
jgi:hypothetical protein